MPARDGHVTCASAGLEAVHLQLLGLDEARLREPLTNVLALVALKLQHLAVLRMLHDGSVARELLLACPHYLLQVIFRREPLHRCESLTPVPLLNTDVD